MLITPSLYDFCHTKTPQHSLGTGNHTHWNNSEKSYDCDGTHKTAAVGIQDPAETSRDSGKARSARGRGDSAEASAVGSMAGLA